VKPVWFFQSLISREASRWVDLTRNIARRHLVSHIRLVNSTLRHVSRDLIAHRLLKAWLHIRFLLIVSWHWLVHRSHCLRHRLGWRHHHRLGLLTHRHHACHHGLRLHEHRLLHATCHSCDSSYWWWHVHRFQPRYDVNDLELTRLALLALSCSLGRTNRVLLHSCRE